MADIQGTTIVQADVPAQTIDVHTDPAALPPTTTSEEDRRSAGGRKADIEAATRKAEADILTTAGQRQINLIWESTQMKIALSVIWAALAVSCVLSILGGYLGTPEVQLAAVVFLFGVANLVTGFYFGRTNHTKTGGVSGEQTR